MSVAALVPVKALDTGKSRLVASVSREQIERLSLAMLEDVVGCLLRVGSIDRVAVVTPDARVGDARKSSARARWLRDDPGLNPSLDAACEELAREGVETLLIVLGDVAGVREEDVEALFTSLRGLGGSGVVLAPSRDGGTSALLRAPCERDPESLRQAQRSRTPRSGAGRRARVRRAPERVARDRPRPGRGRPKRSPAHRSLPAVRTPARSCASSARRSDVTAGLRELGFGDPA